MKTLLVFTDLDGTLLDHQNYDFSAAKPAIKRLEQLGFPLIFNTSKTMAELIPFAQQLNNRHPMICENGSLAVIPDHYFSSHMGDSGDVTHYQTKLFGSDYPTIINILQKLRSEHDFQFQGFNDLGIEGVMQHTGLTREKATLACQRRCSEPLLWQGDQASLESIISELQKRTLSMTKGGRFYHVMSPVDKGQTMAWLLAQYQQQSPDKQWFTIGLGDSNNDIQMLQAADQGVLISNPHSASPDLSHINNLMTPLPPGPSGWNEAVNHIIDLHLKEKHHG